jgi:AcrR family transcriptional regulator
MDKDLINTGDPRRSLELLWGRQEPGRRGPKQRLSTDEVVEAAIALADAEGLAALSMRRVAVAIGVSAMSLYTYVPSKAELVDLMFDRALGAAADPDDAIVGWRARLTFIARQRWALVERHPWILDLVLHRPPLGPNVLKKLEVMLGAFDGTGLTPSEISLAAEALQNYVTGAQQSARDAIAVEAESGMTDEQWVELLRPVLDQHVDAATYPALFRMGETRKPGQARSAAERSARFEFGLERVLDGLEAYIRDPGATPASAA